MLPLQRTAFNNAALWKGGSGVWSATDKSLPSFRVGDGNRFNAWASNPTPEETNVVFANTGGTVAVDSGVVARSLVFDQAGFELTGALTLEGPGVFVSTNWVWLIATISAALTVDSPTFEKRFDGTLVISGTHDISGEIVVVDGILVFDNAATAFLNDLTVDGELEFANTALVSLTGEIAGTGVIRKTGPGFLFVNGANAGARDFVNPVGFSGTFDVPILNRAPVFGGLASNAVIVCKAGAAKAVAYLLSDPDGDAIVSLTNNTLTNGSVSGLSFSGFSYTAANGASNQDIILSATDSLSAVGTATVRAWNFASSVILVDADGATGSYSTASDVVVLAGLVTGRVTKWSPTLTGANTFNFFNTSTPGQTGAGVALSGDFSGFTGTFQVGTLASPAPSGCMLSGNFTLGDPEASVGANAFSSGANATFVGLGLNRAQVFVTNMGGGSLTQSFRLGAYATAYFKAGAYSWTGSFTGSYGDFSSSSTTSFIQIRSDASVALSTDSAGVFCEWFVDSPTSVAVGTCTLPNSPNLANFKFIARSNGSDIGGTFTTTVFSWTGTATGMPVIYHAGFNIATPTLSGGKYYYSLQSSADPALTLTGVLDLAAGTFVIERIS